MNTRAEVKGLDYLPIMFSDNLKPSLPGHVLLMPSCRCRPLLGPFAQAAFLAPAQVSWGLLILMSCCFMWK